MCLHFLVTTNRSGSTEGCVGACFIARACADAIGADITCGVVFAVVICATATCVVATTCRCAIECTVAVIVTLAGACFGVTDVSTVVVCTVCIFCTHKDAGTCGVIATTTWVATHDDIFASDGLCFNLFHGDLLTGQEFTWLGGAVACAIVVVIDTCLTRAVFSGLTFCGPA